MSLLLPAAHGATEYVYQDRVFNPDTGYRAETVLEGPDGLLYSVARRTGAAALHTLVSFKKDGTDFTVIHEFGSIPEDGSPGFIPDPPTLVNGHDGALYGFITQGGTNQSGIIFKLTLEGSVYQVLHTFVDQSGLDPLGRSPTSLVVDSATGTLYGTTANGGNPSPDNTAGLVFKMGTDGSGFTVVKNFPTETVPAAWKPANLMKASDGMLYGSVRYFADQAYHYQLFRMTLEGTGFEIIANTTPSLERFTSLFEGADGRLYGATSPLNDVRGAILALNKDGSNLATLFTLTNVAPGAWFQGADGGLYGPYGNVVQRVDPTTGASNILFNLNNRVSAVIEGSDGVLYGAPETGNAFQHYFRMLPLIAGAPRIFVGGNEVVANNAQYYGTTTFTLTSTIPNAKIFYTTDGSAPTSASIPYVVPFEVSVDTVIRAIAYASDLLSQSGERPALNVDIVPVLGLSTFLDFGVNGDIPGTITFDPPPVFRNPSEPFKSYYTPGTTVTLTVVPDRAYRFIGWVGGGGGTNLTKVVTVSSDMTLRAQFELRPKFPLRTYAIGDESGTIAGNGPTVTGFPVTVQQPEGATVELVAQPKPGYVFLRWQGGGTSNGLTNTVLIDGAKEIVAVFGTTVTTSIVGNGTVEIWPHDGVHEVGTQVRLIPHPAPGHFLAQWGGKGSGTFSPLYLTVGAGGGPQVVTATFTVIPAGQVLLTVIADGPGFVTGPRNTFVPGQVAELAAHADNGELFSGWTYRVGGQDFASLDTSLALTMTENTTVTAHFGATVFPPQITQPPQPVTAVAGYAATFSVQASGAGPLTYEWRHGADLVVEGSRIEGAQTATLKISPLNPSDAGNYTVTVSNPGGAVSSAPVLLTVLSGTDDTDGDGLKSGEEVYLGTNPTLADTDGDGLNDFREARELHTDPLKTDTDGDGFSDSVEVQAGTNPLQAADIPDGKLNAYFAVELEFFTIVGHHYQLQKSADLQTWVNVDGPFTSTAEVSQRFVSARNADSGYWRLVAAP